MKPYKIIAPPRLPTFGLPTVEDLNDLQIGDWVKLIFEPGERMWVRLTDMNLGHRWIGKLDNYPDRAPLKHGDEIVFNPRDIIDVMTDPSSP
jgi:hypothetical protein